MNTSSGLLYNDIGRKNILLYLIIKEHLKCQKYDKIKKQYTTIQLRQVVLSQKLVHQVCFNTHKEIPFTHLTI